MTSDPFGDGMDRLAGRFFGKYPGVVTDVQDPLEIGRLRARVPAVLGEQLEAGWALPAAPFGGGKDRGMLFLPEVGDTVWIEFEAGDVSRPIWTGAFWGNAKSAGGADDLAKEQGAETPTDPDGNKAGPGRGVLRTKGGHVLVLDDEGEVVLLAHGGGKASLRFTSSGEVVVTAETLKLGANAAEKLVLGDSFMQMFNSHTHPTGVGPSGPPAQPMTSAQLSTKVSTE
jgi:uncharacterized protein involved in type VI secretion and phage assembly